MLHIPIVQAHNVSKQIPWEKNFHRVENVTIGSYVSCAFIEIWSTREVWRALKKLELLSATPRATLTHLSCSPNFLRASYLDERTLTYEPIVNLWMRDKDPIKNLQTISQGVCLLICSLFHLIINPRQIMVNLTYVGLLQGMFKKFSFAVTCVY